MIRAASVAVATVAACTVMFGGLGAGVGWVLGTYTPGYYRAMFRSGNEPWFDPVAVGLGQGITQGLASGVAIGLAIVAVLAWREVRLDRQVANAKPGDAVDPDRR